MAFGNDVFRDEEFERVAQEVVEPDLNGWDFFVESQGFRIYRRYEAKSGLYQYKVHGGMTDIDPEVFIQVYMDWEYRKVWDHYVLGLEPIKDKTTETEGLYWCINFPWPLTNRDYTFVREQRVLDVGGRKTHVVIAKSHPFPSYPEKKGIIRVDDFWQCVVIQSDGATGSRAFMHYYDNPKGKLPKWLINWAAKTGVPQFMTTMRKAVFGYSDFLESKRKEMGVETLNNEDRLQKLCNSFFSSTWP